ncbi:MAG: outer membrane protein assembly factor BamD [Candidatus Pelagibacter sp.]|nr:outer membrane protein assembly factor BamD [Candidatus Pelagibacter sp.]OUV87834.1 MAG: hypothetical protein CBC96_01405 [Pelagibacteraceae bacterium TMED136]|tara:strand:+ start:18231 stop:19112 length:882 start_codon:yes stop_codon:yes gene_type:complete
MINVYINLKKNIFKCNFKYLVFVLFFFGALSCSIYKKNDSNIITKPEKIPELQVLFNNALKYYNDGKYRNALKLFKKVETRYSFSNLAPRATLMITYIYYRNADYFNTLKFARKYQTLYPKNKNIDYIHFIIAMTFYEQVQVVAKDQTYTRAALKEFNNIIKTYPNSKYAKESKLKIDLINEQLAGKHMYLARFYMKKSKWISAINRLNIILKDYSETIYTVEALHRMVEIYYKLGNIVLAKKYAATLGYNFNDSDWYKKTYKVVVDKNYKEDTKVTKQRLRDKIKNILKLSK